MQIDVLSQNTLKLTLSRLDMFDLDIRYESLSGKNPDTKRLLSHVLRTVKLDKNAGVDFSGERLFVEAFPRPDGGCMLYISGLSDESDKPESTSNKSASAPKYKNIQLAPRSSKSVKARAASPQSNRGDSKDWDSREPQEETLLCRFEGIKPLESACKALLWHCEQSGIEPASLLYSDVHEYRLLISGVSENSRISAIVLEYGENFSADALPYTQEYYKLVMPEKAIERIAGLSL